MTALGDALRTARERTYDDVNQSQMTGRELARRAGVSHTQISRIEAGEVRKPAPEILHAIARVLESNPRPLLILAGHISGTDAQAELAPMFRPGAELLEEWGNWPRFSVDEVRKILTDPAASSEDLLAIAADVFGAGETYETLWSPVDETVVRGEGQADLRTLINVWRNLGEIRAGQLVDYARALGRLEDLEMMVQVQESWIDAATIATEEESSAAPFGEEYLRAQGFEGYVRITGLPVGCPGVPRTPGVYVVLRRSTAPPSFSQSNPAGRFKGNDPSVPEPVLQAKWVDRSPTIYIGRASDLRQRLDLLARFGRGEPVAHWGGRYMWQLADHDELVVAWQDTTNQVDRESELVAEFRDTYGALPFANINQPGGAR
jgi:transcriptional regulator with XRE-family HTH domain